MLKPGCGEASSLQDVKFVAVYPEDEGGHSGRDGGSANPIQEMPRMGRGLSQHPEGTTSLAEVHRPVTLEEAEVTLRARDAITHDHLRRRVVRHTTIICLATQTDYALTTRYASCSEVRVTGGGGHDQEINTATRLYCVFPHQHVFQ